MATERTQYSSIRCVLPWEEFIRTPGIFAELHLRFENLNILSRSFDKVDKIDVCPKNSLEATGTQREKWSIQLGTHQSAFFESIWNWVYPQDITKLVPVVDVVHIGSI
jgi:hypothetical protein